MKTHATESLSASPSPCRTAPRFGRVALGTAVVVFGAMVTGLALRSAESGRDGAAPTPGGLPVGSIVAFGGTATAVPEAQGWMLCDGRELSAAAFPELSAALGGAWGRDRSGARFRLPDLRGRFLRGVNADVAAQLGDPDCSNRTAQAEGGNVGNAVGSQQGDETGPHIHPLVGVGNALGIGNDAGWVRLFGTKLPDESAPLVRSETSVQAGTGAETRPRNVYVNWIIRVR